MLLLELFNKKEIPKPLGITSAILILYLSYRTISNIADKKKFKNIPVPGIDYPIIGNALSLTSTPGKQVYKWHDELNSPILRLKMGAQNWVMISDPILCQKVLGEHGKKTAARPFGTFGYHLHSRGGQGVAFVNTNKSWREGRSALLGILSPNNVKKYHDLIELEVSKLVDRLINESKKSNGINPHKLLALNAVNVICHVSFGKNYESTDDPEYNQILDMVEKSLYYAGSASDVPNFFPFLSFIHKYLGVEKEMRDFIKNVRDPLLEKLTREARVNKDAPNILRLLEEEYSHISNDQKVVILSDVLNAGVDPIQHILRWSFALLCHFPETQKGMAAEIDSFEKEHGRLPTYYDRGATPLIHSTILECMRIRSPTTFGLPHMATEDVLVDDYCIPAGSLVMPSFDHMQNSPQYVEDGDKIDFKRFMGERRSLLSISRGDSENRTLYAFGWGRRVCPGINLANAEIFSIFVHVFSKCTIQPILGENGEFIYPDHEAGRTVGISTEILPYKVIFAERTT